MTVNLSQIKLICLSLILCLLSGCSTVSRPAMQEPSKQNHLVAVKQGQLEYYKLGQGSPIVLIAGFGADLSTWDRSFVESLSKQHQVIVFNNRKVGLSWTQSSRYDTAALADDTAQLIQNLHLKKPAVIGISMGGMIAQHFAVLYPQRYSHLILINTAIAGKQAIHPSAATEKKLWEMPSSPLGQYFFALNLLFPPEEKWSMAIALMKDRFLPKGYTRAKMAIAMPSQRLLVKQWLSDEGTAKKIPQIKQPVLILNGERDAVIPPINSDILARVIPHATERQWKNGGHAMIYQYPEELAQVITQFIGETKSSS